jgi:sulfate transport system substrate-binding protein
VSKLPGAHAIRAAAAAVVIACASGCTRDAGPAGGELAPVTPRAAPARLVLHFAAFSAAREAYHNKILPQFAKSWFKEHGQELTFVERYGGSGTVTQSIGAAFPADVAVLALTDDLDRLSATGLTRPFSREQLEKAIVSRSLIVLAVRRGNPKAIRDWSDLARGDVRIAVPDPKTSGAGRWSVCALYGAALRGHAGVAPNDPQAAADLVARVFASVVDRSPSAHASFQAFQQGSGDVAITYECEVTNGWMFGHDEERVVPHSTLLVENPAVVIDSHADKHGLRDVAEALITYLHTREAQRLLASYGLRSVHPIVAKEQAAGRSEPEDLWKIDALGGWERASREILAPAGFAPEPASK